jgi:iron complex outermembrane receptor protein
LRYSNDEKDFAADRPQPLFQPPLTHPIERHTEDSNVSGDLSASYRANPNLNFYGKLATGYRGPSIQGRIMFVADFEDGQNPATNGVSVADAETIQSFELGMKSILADQRLRLNLAAYIFQMNDQQLTAVGGQINVATLVNADKVDGHGFEADVEWIPSSYVFASFGLSWNPTEINARTSRSMAAASAAPSAVTIPSLPRAKCPSTATACLSRRNGSSRAFSTSRPTRTTGGSSARSTGPTRDKRFFLYESKEFHSDSLEFGLRLGYGWNGGKYEVALFGRNITDAKIVQGGIDFDNLTGMTNEPRIIGIEFNAKF